MEKFANYIIREKINETRNSIIYRGCKENEPQRIIKLLKTIYPTASEIARFKQEFELIKHIDLDGVIKTFDMVSQDGRFALILEDFDGVSIKSLLESKKRFDLNSFLNISATLAETLGHLHMKGIVHRDIKPHNILSNLKTGEVKITDFGISAILTHENDEIYNPDFIIGTMAYMSPEQTGRMNRVVDYRTDLYSLGVTLYEILTGSRPFKSQDPMALIHSHIAVMPENPSCLDPGIPGLISDIIMRLLAKTPEERYQNGFGVMADIRECLRQVEEKNTIEPFELGMHDISNKFIIPQKLYGREKEIGALISSFEDAVNRGKGAALMIISGAPGIGKSAMVHEIHKPIVAQRGYFISGKFEQFRRDKPYSAIIQAFQSLVRQILTESEERIVTWKQELLSVLGAAGKVITDVIPEVELIIGKQPELPGLGPEESRNRFNFVFEKFTAVFSRKEHPVVLFLDDLQWADLASLHFMENILTSADISHFLFIVSYRDKEIDEIHPIADFLGEDAWNNIGVGRITLGPLNERDIRALVINFLRCTEEKGAGLANLLHQKTGGNPFFVNQFMLMLYNEKMIRLEGASGWQWDADKISRMQVTDNLVELMAGKIGKLSASAQEILKLCACIGNRFDLETLAFVCGLSIDQTLQNLTEAIQSGLVSQLDDIYIFHHDRVQEAAYSLVTDAEKSEIHYKIGKLSLDMAEGYNRQKKLFYIVDQLNLGSNMISGHRGQEELARLNLEAGKMAKASAAYAPAFTYLTTGIKLLAERHWETQHDLALSLYAESTEAAYLIGDFDIMNTLAETALEHAKTALDKVKILVSRINACIAQEDYNGAIDVAVPMVKLFGIMIPRKPSQLRIGIELLKYKLTFFGKKPEDLLDLPGMTDPEICAVAQILSSMAHAAFYADPNLLALITIKSIRLSAKYGLAPEHAFAFTGYGIIRAVGFFDFDGAMKFGHLGLKLIDKLGARAFESRTIYVYNALIRHWSAPIKDTLPDLMEGYRIGLETGDLDYAGLNLFFVDAHAFMAGVDLVEIERSMAKNNTIIAALKQNHILTVHLLVWQKVLILMGKCDDPLNYTGTVMDAEKLLPIWIASDNRAAISSYWFGKLMLYVLYNEYPHAIDAADNFIKYKESMQGIVINRSVLLYDSIARLFAYPDASALTKIRYRLQIKFNQFKMKKMAQSAPMNTLHMVHAVEALYAWLVCGNITRAENNFEQAIQLCKTYDNTSEGGYFNAIAVKFYLSLGDEEKAKEKMAAACSCYSRWGATGLLNQLTTMYPGLAKSKENLLRGSVIDTSPTTGSTLGVALDLSTVMKASQIISSEIMLDRLLQKVMHMSVVNAGAQRGYLILESEGVLTIEASEDVNTRDIKVMQSMALQECTGLCLSIVNYVHRSGEDVILGNALKDGPFTNDPYIIGTQCKSIMCTPIMNKGMLKGLLYMENNLTTDAFTPERLEILRIISAQAAISIDNARLFELATTDGMTKLYVHRYFQLLLDQEMKRSSRHNKQFTLIMIDIDNFKTFNDTYGHQLGDEVLKSVARSIKMTSRAEDIVARYGGEEFVMILPETDAAQAMIAAEKIRSTVEGLEIMHGEECLHVTISLGVAEFPRDAREKEELIRLADAALYTSKHSGKNRVSLSGLNVA
ncbi:MAG: diguanylate cyclase [Proteobacteria bacterium]|nr:diguanylate cyclase [Pseudomonadota bacterium]